MIENGTWSVVFKDGYSVPVEAFAWETLEGWVHFTKYDNEDDYRAGKGLLVLSVPEERVKYIMLIEEGRMDPEEELQELLDSAPPRKAIASFLGLKVRDRGRRDGPGIVVVTKR